MNLSNLKRKIPFLRKMELKIVKYRKQKRFLVGVGIALLYIYLSVKFDPYQVPLLGIFIGFILFYIDFIKWK